MKTEEMKNKMRDIYSYIDSNISGWDLKIKNTIYKGKPSKNSYCFDIPVTAKKEKLPQITEALKNIFIQNPDEFESFERAIKQVCSGSGNEAEKITVLRSSSLCGLLNFYNVSEVPFETEIEEGRSVKFNKVFFEVQNEVLKTPSNIDVVLISDDKKNVLFLESKFAEYFLDNGSLNVSASYLEDNDISKRFYVDDVLKKFDFKICKDKDGNILRSIDEDGNVTFSIDSEDSKILKTKSYVGGIKQMVSHYIGVDNFLNKGSKAITKLGEDLRLPADVNVYLGEILFDFPENTKMDRYLKDYQEKYRILTAELNANQNIKLLPEVLKYSDYKSRLNGNIRRFYYGK